MKLLYLFLFLLTTKPLISQPQKVKLRVSADSLQAVIGKMPAGEEKIKSLNRLSGLFIALDSAGAAMKPARDAQALGETLHDPFGVMISLFQAGTVHFYNGEYMASIASLDSSIVIAEKNRFYSTLLDSLYNNLNNTYFLLGRYPQLMKNALRALALAEQTRHTQKIADYNNIIGCIHLRQNNLPEARKYFTRYLQQALAMQDNYETGKAYLNMGDLLVAEGDPGKALRYYDSSVVHYNKGGNSKSTAYSPEERGLFIAYRSSQANKLLGRYEEALRQMQPVLDRTEEQPATISFNRYDIAGFYMNTGDVYNGLAQPEQAIRYFRKGYTVATGIKDQENLLDAYEGLAESFALKKQYDSAFQYQQKAKQLKEQLANERSRQAIATMEVLAEVEKKDNAIQLLNREKQLQEATIARQRLIRNVIIGLAGLLIIIAALLYNRYRTRQRILYQQQLNEEKHKTVKLLVEELEKERKRIAGDLHDSLGSVLSAAKLKLSGIDDQPGKEEKLASAMKLLDEAAAELRNISHNLMPASLSKLGLTAALHSLFNSVHAGPAIHFNTYGFEERLDTQTEINIYYIVLELFNNVIRHAAAKNLTVQLVRYPDHVNIIAEDDGKGFDPELLKDVSFGLANIRSRVELQEGMLDIDTSPGSGTVVVIDLPYRNNDNK